MNTETIADSRMVPAGTRCRLRMKIRPGNGVGGLTLSNDSRSQAKYLLVAFTVTAPEQFADVSFLDRFGTHGKNGQPTGYYAEQGRLHIRRMARSAGIKLKTPGDLNGAEIVALVGVRQRSFKNADGKNENHINEILVPGDEAYQDGDAS